ncbi:cupin domain-containing protein [Flectobacillus sp. DC10W]|jgi:quercetin 2,3-dioxygenase|uniref:Cupin domain-containing protein n=1 Tax=Flectobacillus longus TaxID=2984207 RepID=A0ABT6YHB6_9BACT|nr:cupin domain-containing protein [Flectobacillus longus]MDI9862972.1 cupin domain-containing protein [Flectobacillus longus]
MQRRNFLSTSVVLGSTLTQVSAKTNQAQTTPFVIRSGESRFQESTQVGLSPNNIKVSSKDTNGLLTVFEYVGKEKGGPPLHIHPNQDEIFFIVEGEYLFQVGKEQYRLKAGDTIFLPRNIPHAFAQTSSNGKLFFMFQPSGKMEDFFRALGALKTQPTPEEGARIFAAHDMQVVGPPLQF